MTLSINGVTAGPLLRKMGLADSTEAREKIIDAYQTRFKTHLIGTARTFRKLLVNRLCRFSFSHNCLSIVNQSKWCLFSPSLVFNK